MVEGQGRGFGIEGLRGLCIGLWNISDLPPTDH